MSTQHPITPPPELEQRVATDAELCQLYNDGPEHGFGPAIRAVYDLGRKHGAARARAALAQPEQVAPTDYELAQLFSDSNRQAIKDACSTPEQAVALIRSHMEYARAALAQPAPVGPTTPSEWHLLSLEQPSLNALCEYICHANNWGVIQGKGKWREQTNPTVSGFANSHGWFVSDPTQTLWRLAQPAPVGPEPGYEKGYAQEHLARLMRDAIGTETDHNVYIVAAGKILDRSEFAHVARWGTPTAQPVPVSTPANTTPEAP